MTTGQNPLKTHKTGTNWIIYTRGDNGYFGFAKIRQIVRNIRHESIGNYVKTSCKPFNTVTVTTKSTQAYLFHASAVKFYTHPNLRVSIMRVITSASRVLILLLSTYIFVTFTTA
jgi:hypothetical protein